MSKQVRVAVIGASGYTGAELLRLLGEHPAAVVTRVMARRAAGTRLGAIFPQFLGRLELTVEAFDAAAVAAACDVAFVALPHGESALVVAELCRLGVRTLDLSADFRLRDAQAWSSWYGGDAHASHPAAELLASAVYGLPEFYRAQLRGAQLVAVPGCYPTATLLPTVPLLRAGLIAASGLIVDAKSGASGAGRNPSAATHLPEAGEGIRAYKVAGTHRHTVEMEQELSVAAGASVSLLFTPHLVPMSRGILSCVYATPTSTERDAGDYRAALVQAYADEPFLTVLPEGAVPDTGHVRGSNRAHLAAFFDGRTGRVLLISAIDNLVKGAAGQAVQCMNLMLGLPETSGLLQGALFP
jgi:N-acetyl-gamma-glutamyl-phosphate reductase